MSDVSQRLAQLSPAKRALFELQAREKTVEPIAIIGAACRLPGGVHTLDGYWQLLRDGVDAISEVPSARWDLERYYDADPDAPGKMSTRWGGFLDQIDQFDPQFFGISAREAERMDPQQRLLLEVAWEALEHAGYGPDRLRDNNAGVFVGISTSDYVQLHMKGLDAAILDAYGATGNAFSVACGRISYLLGLTGPSLALDTACSSSLVAVHLAARSLRSGECSMALAGGVNVMLLPEVTINFSKAHMMAPDGRCKTFDASADGYVRGEGCGLVILKPLSKALADRDHILALLLGSAVNQDGRTSGLTAPNGRAQQSVIAKALADAGIDPAQLGYVEAHGTGTSLGDPIEMQALATAMKSRGARYPPLAVGSVKTNIGHLEAAAGIAGLLKVVLALQHGEIPPHLHLKKLNPHIPAQDTLVIPTERVPWPSAGGPRIGGVSAFGFSGTNGHVVIQEAPRPEIPKTDAGVRPFHLLTLSAKTASALQSMSLRYVDKLSTDPTESIASIAFTTSAGRSHFSQRLAVVARSVAEARDEIASFAAGHESPAILRGQERVGARPNIAFLFTGQGSQYPGMARQLYETEPTFRRVLQHCHEFLRGFLVRPLLDVLYPQAGFPTPLDDTAYAQPALFAIECALAELWRSWGIEPGVVMGHSVGEYAAAYFAGVFDLETGLTLVAERGRLMSALPRTGEMVVVFADEKSVAAALAGYEDRAAIAAINAPNNTVVSGDATALRGILRKLAEQGLEARHLNTSHAFHSPLVEPILGEFERIAGQQRFRPLQMRLVSNLTGKLLKPGDEMDAVYWRRQLRQPVRFMDGMGELARHGYDTCVELGPNATLLGLGMACRPSEQVAWLPSLRERGEDCRVLMTSVAALYCRGANPEWMEFHRHTAGRRVPLPTYPFERERCWMETGAAIAESPSVNSSRSAPNGVGSLSEGLHVELADPPGSHIWEFDLGRESFAYLDDCRIFGATSAPASLYLEMASRGFEQASGAVPAALHTVDLQKALFLPDARSRVLQMIVAPGSGADRTVRFYSRAASSQIPKNWTLHASGRIRSEPGTERAATAAPSLEDIRSRCPREVTAQQFYSRLRAQDLEFGPLFQGIEHIRRREGESLAQLRAPAVRPAESGVNDIHPALLDACLQALMAALPADEQDQAGAPLYLPVSVSSFQLRGKLEGQVWSHATLRADRENGCLVGDVQVLNERGKVLAKIAGVVLRQADAPAQASRDAADLLYQLEWRRKDRPEEAAYSRNGRWLILADRSGVGSALAELMQTRGQTCSVRFDPEALDLTGEDDRELLGIIHLRALDCTPVEQTSPDSLERDQTLSCGSLLTLTQTVIGRKWPASPRLWLVTKGAVAVSGDESVAVAQAPVWGFGRTLAQELPGLWGGMIDLDGKAEASASAAALLAEISLASDGEDQVAFRGGQRHVARFIRRNQAIPVPSVRHLDEPGTYWITGGLGDLGLLVAGWLVRRGARHLVLSGRSGLAPKSGWDAVEKGTRLADQIHAIREMEAAGAKVRIAAVDVTDEAGMAATLAACRAEGWPPVRGAVHAAGVMRGATVPAMDPRAMETVMRPKIIGGWVLHRLLEREPLDFLFLFSSIAAPLGWLGQGAANYAAANAFLDGLAHYRRAQGLPALSINWGPWNGIGQAARAGDALDRLARQGINSIDPAQGLDLLDRMLSLEQPQCAACAVDWNRFFRAWPGAADSRLLEDLLLQRGDRRTDGSSEIRLELLAAEGAQRVALLDAYLRRQLAGVLKGSPSKLDIQQPLSNLGLDSLMALTLKNRIEIDLGIRLSMATFLQGASGEQVAQQLLAQLGTDGAVGMAPEIRRQPVNGPLDEAEADRQKARKLLDSVDDLTDQEVDRLLHTLGNEG